MAGPLHGYTVLDFGRFEMGPLAAVWLADMGADVIKVEARTGDPVRGPAPISAAIVTAHNRGKRSIAIDLTRPEGREIALTLASRADVLLHNFRRGVMERLGLGYEDVRRVNERIIYAEASAFGPRGAKADAPGFDTIGQAMGGLAYATGMPGGPPIPAGAAIADAVGSYALVGGILAALLERERSGVGQAMEVSLYGTQIALQSWEVNYCAISGQAPKRNGCYPYLIGYGIFETRDGYIAIVGLGDEGWQTFCALFQRPDLAERFAASTARFESADEVMAVMREVLRKYDTAWCLKHMTAAGLIVSPVQSYVDILKDPQAWENGYLIEVEHHEFGRLKVAGNPWTFSRTPVEPSGGAPELGAHTEQILLECGYGWDEITSFREAGVIGIETA